MVVKKKKVERTVININSKIVDSETGEVIEEIKEDDDKAKRIIVEEMIDDTSERIIYDYNKDNSFIKIFVDAIKLMDILSLPEYALTIKLLRFLCYDDCILRRGGSHKGKILTIKDISEELNIKYNTIR